MSTNQERLAKAAAAGRRAGSSPYKREQRMGAGSKIWVAGVYAFDIAVGVWLNQHHAPWWMQAGFWIINGTAAFILVVFGPVTRKIKRRSTLMAKEQVFRVRQLDAADPVALNLGLLFDADASLDHFSAQAGAQFALSHVHAVLDEVEAETPPAKFWGTTMNDDGTVKK